MTIIEFQPIPTKESTPTTNHSSKVEEEKYHDDDEECYFDDFDDDDEEMEQQQQYYQPPSTKRICGRTTTTTTSIWCIILTVTLLVGGACAGGWLFSTKSTLASSNGKNSDNKNNNKNNNNKKNKWPIPTIRDQQKDDDAMMIYHDSNNNKNIQTIQDIMDAKLPYLIYGTAWKEDYTAMYVNAAIQNGFVFIDTANQPKHYNETGVGIGWKQAAAVAGAGGLSRSQVYLQTKFSKNQDLSTIPYDPQANLSTQVRQSVESSLQHLQTDYLDAYILHSPLSTPELTLEVWKAMETLVDQGTVKRIGISNCYSLTTFRQLYDAARIKPTILQNHFRVHDFNTELFDFTKQHNIEYQGFWTLTSNRNLLKKPEIIEMAASVDVTKAKAAKGDSSGDGKGMTPQEYMYSFLLEIGIVPLDGTKTHQIDDTDLMYNLQTKSIQPFQNPNDVQKMAMALGLKL